MMPEQLKALGIEPVAWRHIGEDVLGGLYPHSDLMKVCEAYEARIAELKGALESIKQIWIDFGKCSTGEDLALLKMASKMMVTAHEGINSNTQPLTTLEEYRKKVLMEAAADVKLLRPSLTPLGIALEIEGMAEEAGK